MAEGGPQDRLVIFDCDGVLVDSEPISIAVLTEAIAAAGGSIDQRTAYRRFLGRSMATIVQDLRDEFSLALSPDQLSQMRARLHARFEVELQPVEGVAEALEAIPARFCVASSSQPERIRHSLRVTGLLESFEPAIYSSTMVVHGKPAPDLFLHAAAAMGVVPQRCIVVEDSPAGIQAAKAAGMAVLAFIGGSHAGECGLAEKAAVLKPDGIFDDMRQLPKLVRQMTARVKRL